MKDLNTLLREIHSHADSLATFAKHAAVLDSTVSSRKNGYVENTLQTLAVLQSLQSDLRASVQAEQARQAANTQAYTTLDGEDVVPPIMDWLEDGGYYDEDQADDEYTFGILPCSRYCIGVDENGDGLSVWLNDDMQEVEV